MPARKRRATDNNVVQAQEMSSVSSDAVNHIASALPSTISHFITNPFSPLPSGFSPAFSFSPLPSSSKAHGDGTASTHLEHTYDPTFSMPAPPDFPAAAGGGDTSGLAGLAAPPPDLPAAQLTPTDSASVHTDPDKDPFLSLLEQLAENEHSRGGPSELDFFLSAAAA